MSVSARTVSVIIPCFNQARYLAEAIASVLSQRGDGPEVIVVDDGSTDETVAVARSFPGVRCLSQRNSGTAVARNRGWQSSRGNFVLFLDSDDRLRAGALSAAVSRLESKPDCAFAYGFVDVIHPDGSFSHCPPQESVEDEPYRQLLRHNYIWSPGSVLYRRSAVEEVGGFRRMAGGCADLDMNLRIARRHAACCVGEVVLEYRRHPGSQSGNTAEMLRSALRVRRAQRSHVAGRPELEEALREGMRRDRAYYGGRLVGALASQWREHRWMRAVEGVATLLLYDPVRFWERLSRRAA
jgi:Glycosyl transferase family 2